MFSVNVPVPGEVKRLAGELVPALQGFDRVRERHTLVCKRLDDDAEGGRDRTEGRVRHALAGAPAFEARISGLEVFEEPLAGPGPVLYLAVESPGLNRVHRQLVGEFGVVPDFEGEEYVPHVTLARGGPPGVAEPLLEREIEPVTWTVNELAFWDAAYAECTGTIALPA